MGTWFPIVPLREAATIPRADQRGRFEVLAIVPGLYFGDD